MSAGGSARLARTCGWRALAFFVCLAVLHTWPLMSAPGYWSRNDNADAQLNEWALTWVARTLPTNPLRLFDANIFHPEPRTLAFSEALVVQGVMAMPLYWLGASPVLTMNLVDGPGPRAQRVVDELRRDSLDRQLVRGPRGGQPRGVQYVHALENGTRAGHARRVLPLALLALDGVLDRGAGRLALQLGVLFALQGLSSGYLLVMTIVTMVASTLSRVHEWATRHLRRTLWLLAAAGATAMAILGPFLWPYMLARHSQGLTRELDEVAMYWATVSTYTATTGRLHYAWWSHAFCGRTTRPCFPGCWQSCSDWSGMTGARALGDRRARMFAWTAVAGVLLSLGPTLPGYAWLHAHVPLLQGVRAVSRFGYLGIFGLAGLSGYGVAWLSSRMANRRLAGALGVAAVLVVNVESLRAPLDFVPFKGIPRVYDVLATETQAVVAEFPFPTRRDITHNGQYMLH